jgi:hypothetical protein
MAARVKLGSCRSRGINIGFGVGVYHQAAAVKPLAGGAAAPSIWGSQAIDRMGHHGSALL